MLFFLKFGQLNYMEEFRKGSLFFQRLQVFRSHEKDLAKRNDIYEGASSIFSPKEVEVIIDNHKINPEELSAPLRMNFSKQFPDYSLSLYSITDKSIKDFLDGINSYLIDPRNETLGTHCVAITNNVEFQKRISNACKILNLNVREKLIEYHDPNQFSGKWGDFKKPHEYSYQSEYRIMIDGQQKEENFYKLEIGDISDISIIGTYQDITSKLKIKTE